MGLSWSLSPNFCSLGIADRGEIAAGQIADLVLVDDSLSPRMTIVGGEVMHS